jgi:ribonuclease P protein component
VIWRVRGRAAFAALTRAPRASAEPLSLRVVCTDDASPPRVAYAVGRAVGPAVVRNRVRRRLRAAVRELRELFRTGCSYLVAARPSAADATYGEVVTALRACLGRVEVV